MIGFKFGKFSAAAWPRHEGQLSLLPSVGR